MIKKIPRICQKASPKKSSGMDAMFAKYKNYGNGVNTENITDEDCYDCEDFLLPKWFWDIGIELIQRDAAEQ